MKVVAAFVLCMAFSLGVAALHAETMTGADSSGATAAVGNELIAFPESYRDGVHYNTIDRGSIREEMYTSEAAIAAAKSGKPLPDGTVILNEWYEDGQLTHYFVMEKRIGWGADYSEDARAGDWRFRDFHPDRSPNLSDNGTGCMACHRSQAAKDFVWTRDRMNGAQ